MYLQIICSATYLERNRSISLLFFFVNFISLVSISNVYFQLFQNFVYSPSFFMLNSYSWFLFISFCLLDNNRHSFLYSGIVFVAFQSRITFAHFLTNQSFHHQTRTNLSLIFYYFRYGYHL